MVQALGTVASLWGAVRMAVANAPALTSIGNGVHDVFREEHDPGLVHPNVHPLPFASEVAVA